MPPTDQSIRLRKPGNKKLSSNSPDKNDEKPHETINLSQSINLEEAVSRIDITQDSVILSDSSPKKTTDRIIAVKSVSLEMQAGSINIGANQKKNKKMEVIPPYP